MFCIYKQQYYPRIKLEVEISDGERNFFNETGPKIQFRINYSDILNIKLFFQPNMKLLQTCLPRFLPFLGQVRHSLLFLYSRGVQKPSFFNAGCLSTNIFIAVQMSNSFLNFTDVLIAHTFSNLVIRMSRLIEHMDLKLGRNISPPTPLPVLEPSVNQQMFAIRHFVL